MNLILLFSEDFVDDATVRLTGRRLRHVLEVHRAEVGAQLFVGRLDGAMGRGRVTRLEAQVLEMQVELDQPPPPKLPLTLLLALPRPKVLNRVLAAAASLGVARIVLLNAWKVEKAYWNSPKLEPDNLRQQLILGLEQAKDTVLPDLRVARFFRPFMEDELPGLAQDHLLLAAHPGSPDAGSPDAGSPDAGSPDAGSPDAGSPDAGSPDAGPRALAGPVVLAIGPEGGWIDVELASLRKAGFHLVDLGPRILRVETALAALIGRLF